MGDRAIFAVFYTVLIDRIIAPAFFYKIKRAIAENTIDFVHFMTGIVFAFFILKESVIIFHSYYYVKFL